MTCESMTSVEKQFNWPSRQLSNYCYRLQVIYLIDIARGVSKCKLTKSSVIDLANYCLFCIYLDVICVCVLLPLSISSGTTRH